MNIDTNNQTAAGSFDPTQKKLTILRKNELDYRVVEETFDAT